MMIAAWLGSGILAAAVACLGKPSGYLGGPATALAAGLCGGFLGGAFVILLAGRHGVLPALSVCGALVGAIVTLNMAERTSGPITGTPRSRRLARLWSRACLLDPLMLATTVAAAVGAATQSSLLGVLVGSASVLAFYLQPTRIAAVTRTWRRHRDPR